MKDQHLHTESSDCFKVLLEGDLFWETDKASEKHSKINF